ncbi:MAG: T9SS type A sorting domain-containing protein [Flavobacteriales bacterium]|nr:T9SS type A sorting domain-containing protein [Flavobacteriales bacterium]MCC6938746.1 T9SS type A sorting domain-containing protein [Flavobacteriales bacterium]
MCAQIPNGDFEDWVDQGSYMEPVGWLTGNYWCYTQGLPVGVVRGEPGYSGQYYLSARRTNDLMGSSTIHCLGDNPNSGLVLQPGVGFPVSGRPAYLTGVWRSEGFIYRMGAVFLSRWDDVTMERISIAATLFTDGLWIQPPEGEDWVPFAVGMTYFSDLEPDTAAIVFSDESGSGTYSRLDLDALSWTGQVAVEEIRLQEIQLFPTVTSGELRVILPGSGVHSEVSVVDPLGRSVRQFRMVGNVIDLDLGDLRSGTYVVTILTDDGIRASRKFIKN